MKERERERDRHRYIVRKGQRRVLNEKSEKINEVRTLKYLYTDGESEETRRKVFSSYKFFTMDFFSMQKGS